MTVFLVLVIRWTVNHFCVIIGSCDVILWPANDSTQIHIISRTSDRWDSAVVVVESMHLFSHCWRAALYFQVRSPTVSPSVCGRGCFTACRIQIGSSVGLCNVCTNAYVAVFLCSCQAISMILVTECIQSVSPPMCVYVVPLLWSFQKLFYENASDVLKAALNCILPIWSSFSSHVRLFRTVDADE